MPSVPLDPDLDTLRDWLDVAGAWLLDRMARLPDAGGAGAIGAAGLEVANRVSVPIPEAPYGELGAVLDHLAPAFDASLTTNGPGYVAYVPGGGLPAAGVAQLVAAWTNRYTGISAAAPALARLEADVLAWLAYEFGYGSDARGVLLSGGSMATLAAVVAARHAAYGEGGDFRDARVYTSSEAHHCVAKAARMAGIPRDNVRLVPVDARLRMDADALSALLDSDPGRPFLVVASAGTVGTGAVDPLHAIAEICARRGLWMHVDGAYGGAWVLCEEGRRRLAGIERADSICFDPHKGLFLPYGSGCLLVRDGRRLAEAHASDAPYLADFDRLERAGEAPSPATYGPELSRPFRGLALWLPLALHGAGAFREALAEKLDLAHLCWKRLVALGLDVVSEPDLTTVAFRLPRRSDETDRALDARNTSLLADINGRGSGWLSSTRVHGLVTLRICIVSFRTRQDRIEALLADIEGATASAR